jgi:5-methylcytosine-specific restriction endonuclease McrA
MSFPPKKEPRRYCRFCRRKMYRKRYGGRIEDMAIFLRRKYCDQLCMARAMVKRTPTRSAYLWRARKLRGSKCQDCGRTDRLHIHHKDGDVTNNSPENLETLCTFCHGKHHGSRRGRLLATGRWILKDDLYALTELLRESLETHPHREAAKEVLHRLGQL